MLTRLLRRAAVAAAAAMALVCLAQVSALAGGGLRGGPSGSGGLSDIAQCGQSSSPLARSPPGPARRPGRPAPPARAEAQPAAPPRFPQEAPRRGDAPAP